MAEDIKVLDSETKTRIQNIVAEQKTKTPDNQDWSGLYTEVSNFIRSNSDAGFSAGVDYFFANAAKVNLGDPTDSGNFFIRQYYGRHSLEWHSGDYCLSTVFPSQAERDPRRRKLCAAGGRHARRAGGGGGGVLI